MIVRGCIHVVETQDNSGKALQLTLQGQIATREAICPQQRDNNKKRSANRLYRHILYSFENAYQINRAVSSASRMLNASCGDFKFSFEGHRVLGPLILSHPNCLRFDMGSKLLLRSA